MGIKSFFKKAKKFVKKAAPVALGAAGMYYGMPALGSMMSSAGAVSSAVNPGGGGMQSYDLPPNSGSPPAGFNYGSGTSPGLWGMAGNLAGPLFQGGLSFLGGERANAANARQAQNQMDFQRQMSDTSYQRGTADMQAAGLNPMLAYSQGGASSPGGASSGISDAISPALNSGRAAQMAGATVENLKAQNANINANTQNTNADTLSKILQPASINAAIDSTRQNTANAKTAGHQASQNLEFSRETFDADVSAAKAASMSANYRLAGEKNMAEFQKTAIGAVLPYITGILGSVNSAISGAGKVSDIIDTTRRTTQRGRIINLNR